MRGEIAIDMGCRGGLIGRGSCSGALRALRAQVTRRLEDKRTQSVSIPSGTQEKRIQAGLSGPIGLAESPRAMGEWMLPGW